MARWALVLGAIFLFSGCADNTEDAKKALQAKLHNSPDVEYRALKNFPGGVVCGEYNPEGEWGIREGYRRFIVRNNEADRIASEDDWEIFCSKKPAAKLQDRFGVGPMNKKNAALLQVHRDLNGFDLALNAYLRDNFTFPVTNQGLDALVNASKTAPKPGKFREGAISTKYRWTPGAALTTIYMKSSYASNQGSIPSTPSAKMVSKVVRGRTPTSATNT